jgi:hypothetical protein
MSDVLSRIATGGAHRERKYFTNDGREEIFVFQNPVVINGITELPERPDLLDRSIVVHMQPITENARRDERTFWMDFEAARPRLLGAVLDAVCAGMHRVGAVDVPALPRMADFCRWGCAVEGSLGYASGTFMRSYRQNLEDANAYAIESSPIAVTIRDFLLKQSRRTWRGPSLRLLQKLTEFIESNESAGQALIRKHPRWPRSANALSGEISRIEPSLKKLNVAVDRGRNATTRWIQMTIESTVNDDSTDAPVTPQMSPEKEVGER